MERTIINPIPRSHHEAAAAVEGAIGSWVPIIVVLGVVYFGAKIAVSQVPAIEGALSTRIQGAAGPNILNGPPAQAPTVNAAPSSISTTVNALPGPVLSGTYTSNIGLPYQATPNSAGGDAFRYNIQGPNGAADQYGVYQRPDGSLYRSGPIAGQPTYT